MKTYHNSGERNKEFSVRLLHPTPGTTTEAVGDYLRARPGQWVPAPELSILSLAYTRCIHELRHIHDWNIGNKTEPAGEKRKHGFYRLLSGSWKECHGRETLTPIGVNVTSASKSEAKAEQNSSNPPATLFRDLADARDFCSFETGCRR